MVRIAGEGGIVGFGYDPRDGEILLADLNSGVIRKLVAQEVTASFPQTLAATGLFSDAAALVPANGMNAYDVNLPFWSDHAVKRRWFGIPNPNAMIGFSEEGAWDYPEGMLWVKHFDIETVRGDPGSLKRLETRVIVRNATGSYGVSYRWNEAGTVATLAAPEGEEFDVTIDDGGSVANQRWRIPSRASCITCHSGEAGHSLSFRTRQLNRAGSLDGDSGNFVSLLDLHGYLEGLDVATGTLPRHASPDETSVAIEERARAYLDVNCSYCHNEGGSVPAQWDARSFLPLFETGMINGAVLNGAEDPADRLIIPGLDQRSVIVNRTAARNNYTRMPPLGSNVVDEEGVQLLTDWINGSLTTRESFADWRVRFYGDPPSGGAPAADDDSDGRTNFQEFLSMTDPLTADDASSVSVDVLSDSLQVGFENLAGRSVFIDASDDLSSWEPLDVSGNDGLPRAVGEAFEFTMPFEAPSKFFRARIIER